jgi:hypothetical protein
MVKWRVCSYFILATFWINKNTLCNGCNLTGWSVFNSESSCIQIMFKSKKVSDLKLPEDVHEESLWNPRQNSRLLCNRLDGPLKASGRAFEGVWTPLSVQQITMKMSGRQSNTVRTLCQSVFNKELGFRSRHCLGRLCKPSRRRGNTSARCPVFQKISEFRSNAERILAKTVWKLSQAVRTWTW